MCYGIGPSRRGEDIRKYVDKYGQGGGKISLYADVHNNSSKLQSCSYIAVVTELSLPIFSLTILTAIFQMNLGQPVFIEAKDDRGGCDNWTAGAISYAKLQSNYHHQQSSFFTGRMPFLSPNQHCQSTEGKNTTFHGLANAYPQAHLGSSNFVSDH